jgi:hypothetical protein
MGTKNDYHRPMDMFRNKVLELVGVDLDNVIRMEDFR